MAKISEVQIAKLILGEVAAPATPAAGTVVFYAKADGKIYSKDDAGAETLVSGGAAGAAAFVGAHAYHSATQSIPNVTMTAALLDSELYDTDAFHDTATNNSRITIPAGKAGKYLLVGSVLWANTGANRRIVIFRKNGTTDLANPDEREGGNGVYNPASICTTVADLAAADYVEMMVYQNSGGALAIGDGTYAQNQTSIKVVYLGA